MFFRLFSRGIKPEPYHFQVRNQLKIWQSFYCNFNNLITLVTDYGNTHKLYKHAFEKLEPSFRWNLQCQKKYISPDQILSNKIEKQHLQNDNFIRGFWIFLLFNGPIRLGVQSFHSVGLFFIANSTRTTFNLCSRA